MLNLMFNLMFNFLLKFLTYPLVILVILLPILSFATALSDLPGWNSDHQAEAIPALLHSCKKTSQNSNTLSKSFCTALEQNPNLSDSQTRVLLMKYFTAIPVTNHGQSTGLFTGYYQPTITGSLTQTPEDSVPIYGNPPKFLKPFPDRNAIDVNNALANTKTPVLAWVHSNIDRFFLQIQGSGTIECSNGQNLLVGYAGQNGKKYYPIGAYLLKIGALAPNNISMQTIKDWLDTHPKQAQAVMNLNPSFVFFRILKTPEPTGAHGTELTPYRSLAVDPKFTSLGTPVWLASVLPKNNISFDHLLMAEDTGGAIKGPVRGDVFFGDGDQAEWLAGHMQSPGKLWVLKAI